MLELIQNSTVQAINLAKLKSYLKIDHNEEDETLKLMVNAATSLVEQETSRSLLSKTWHLRAIGVPTPEGLSRITLPYPPLVEIVSVGQVVDDSKVVPYPRYTIEWERTHPSLLVSAKGKVIDIVYKAGYGERASSIPAALRQAILLLATEMYEHRSATTRLPPDSLAKVLIQPFCQPTYC